MGGYEAWDEEPKKKKSKGFDPRDNRMSNVFSLEELVKKCEDFFNDNLVEMPKKISVKNCILYLRNLERDVFSIINRYILSQEIR
jgi:hypothetical protein